MGSHESWTIASLANFALALLALSTAKLVPPQWRTFLYVVEVSAALAVGAFGAKFGGIAYLAFVLTAVGWTIIFVVLYREAESNDEN